MRPALLIVLAACTGSGSPLEERCNVGEADTTIDTAAIEGRYLHLGASFSGGCEEHDFALTWSGAVGASNPPVTEVTLRHDGNADSCEAWLHRDLYFDLSLMDATLNETSTPSVRVVLDQQPFVLMYAPNQPDAPPNAEVLPLIVDCAATR